MKNIECICLKKENSISTISLKYMAIYSYLMKILLEIISMNEFGILWNGSSYWITSRLFVLLIYFKCSFSADFFLVDVVLMTLFAVDSPDARVMMPS